MTNLTNALFRIDPTQGLLAYAQAVKPYHSKVLDIFVEYVYSERLTSKVTDRMSLNIELTNYRPPVVNLCGFGYAWDPYAQAAAPELFSVVSAYGAQHGTNSNSFLISDNSPTEYNIMVRNLKSNQFIMTAPLPVVFYTSSPTDQLLVLGGSQSNPSAIVAPGASIYIGRSDVRRYTVVSVVYSSVNDNTMIKINEPVTIDGLSGTQAYIATKPDNVPAWLSGSAVKLSAPGGTYPAPISLDTTYYFTPTQTVGVFNLSHKRHSSAYADIVDITTVGSGLLSIRRTEPYVPGQTIQISSDPVGGTNGIYTVKSVVQEGPNFRVFVFQRIPHDNIQTGNSDFGAMQYGGTYGDPYCPVANPPPLYADTFIHESLVFDFGPDPTTPLVDPLAYDVQPFV